MNEEEDEELKWLRENYISQKRFRIGCSRGLTLGIIFTILTSFLSLESIITRVGHIVSTVIVFNLAFISAYYGKYKWKYER